MRTRILYTAALVCAAFGSAQAADHLDSPAVTAEPAADINDLYAFVSPQDENAIVLIMTVHPLAGAESSFSDAVTYTFNVLRTRDSALRTVDCTFESNGAFRCAGPGGAVANGTVGGGTAMGDSIKAWAGLRDDPFFFDLEAFRAVTAGGEGNVFCVLDPESGGNGDFFAGLNVLSIVVEIRSEVFTQGLDASNDLLAIWAATTRREG